MFLGALDPFRYNSIWGLRFALVSIQFITILSIYYLVKAIFIKSYSLRRVTIISLFIFVVFINSIISVFEFSYWYPSATAYQFSLALSTFFLGNIILEKSNRISLPKYLLFNSMIATLSIGLIELSIVPLIIMLILSSIYDIKAKKSIKPTIFLLFIVACFGLLMVLAPGNYQRHNSLGASIHLLSAVFLTIKTTIYTLSYLIQNPSFTISIVLIFSLIVNSNSKLFSVNIPTIKPLILVISSVIIISSIFFPSVLILNHLPPSRVINFGSYFSMIVLLFNILIIAKQVKQKGNFKISRKWIGLFAALIIVFSFSGIHAVNKNEFAHGNYKSIFFQGNILKAYYVFLFEARDFDTEMSLREDLIRRHKKNGAKSVAIKPIIFHTSLHNFLNINENNYEFNWEAKYYNLDSIYIESKTNTK